MRKRSTYRPRVQLPDPLAYVLSGMRNVALLDKAMRDYSIWFHLLDEGESVDDGFFALHTMALTLLAAKPQAKLSDAVCLMDEIQERGTWRKADLDAMLEALSVVGYEYPRLPKDVAHKALLKMFEVSHAT